MVSLGPQRVLRYEVPRDDMPHAVALGGDPMAVAPIGLRAVEFWALDRGVGATLRTFLVVGTGQALPSGDWKLWGSVVIPVSDQRVVWHLMEGLHL